jgi:hypothetical protein
MPIYLMTNIMRQTPKESIYLPLLSYDYFMRQTPEASYRWKHVHDQDI